MTNSIPLIYLDDLEPYRVFAPTIGALTSISDEESIGTIEDFFPSSSSPILSSVSQELEALPVLPRLTPAVPISPVTTTNITTAVITLEKPKRPRTAYNFFFKDERQRFLDDLPVRPGCKSNKNSHGKIGFADMGRVIASRWRMLQKDAFQKDYYNTLAATDKTRYQLQMNAYKEELKRREFEGLYSFLLQKRAPNTQKQQIQQQRQSNKDTYNYDDAPWVANTQFEEPLQSLLPSDMASYIVQARSDDDSSPSMEDQTAH